MLARVYFIEAKPSPSEGPSRSAHWAAHLLVEETRTVKSLANSEGAGATTPGAIGQFTVAMTSAISSLPFRLF